MKYLIISLTVAMLFSCNNKTIISQRATNQEEVIDTIYGFSHVWIGPRSFIDSAYAAFLNGMHSDRSIIILEYGKNSLGKCPPEVYMLLMDTATKISQ